MKKKNIIISIACSIFFIICVGAAIILFPKVKEETIAYSTSIEGMLRKMLIYEGIIYVGGVLGLLLIIGSIVMGIVVYILKQNIEYFVFQYPFEGLLCIICIMSFLCVIIPNIFLHKMERNSLIERIKKER